MTLKPMTPRSKKQRLCSTGRTMPTMPRMICLSSGLFFFGCSESGDDRRTAADQSTARTRADNVAAGPGTTNLVALNYRAASSGALEASATGSCLVVSALPVDSVVAVTIETNATASTAFTDEGNLEVSGFTTGIAYPFSISRTLQAIRGLNSVYVNISDPSTGGALSCSVELAVSFTPAPAMTP